jgi:hypothetical protein
MSLRDARFETFEQRYQRRLFGPLGVGVGQDGRVVRSDRNTAVKFFDSLDRFEREWEVYSVLTLRKIHFIGRHRIPRLIAADPGLQTIEMTIVERPFVLDFAGAKWSHEVPDFDEAVMEEHHEHLRQLFDDRWTDALQVAEAFRQATGFVLLDIHPGNIAFED